MIKTERSGKSWDTLKREGAAHYKTGLVEPIDLYRAGGILKPFAIGCIIKYAYRQRERISVSDCDKIIHYAQMIKNLAQGGEK